MWMTPSLSACGRRGSPRQAVEFRGIADLDRSSAVVDVALERRLLFRECVVERLQTLASRVVLVDAGEPEFEQTGAAHSNCGGRIGMSDGDCASA